MSLMSRGRTPVHGSPCGKSRPRVRGRRVARADTAGGGRRGSAHAVQAGGGWSQARCRWTVARRRELAGRVHRTTHNVAWLAPSPYELEATRSAAGFHAGRGRRQAPRDVVFTTHAGAGEVGCVPPAIRREGLAANRQCQDRIRLAAASWNYSIGKQRGKLTGSTSERLAALEQLLGGAPDEYDLLIGASPDIRAADVLRVAGLAVRGASLQVLEPRPSSPAVRLGAVEPKPFSPAVRLSSLDAGGLSVTPSKKVLAQRLETFRQCYLLGLDRNRDLHGRVGIRLVISTDGSVANVSSSGTDLPDPLVVSCVERQMYRLRFAPPGKPSAVVVARFIFSPGSA